MASKNDPFLKRHLAGNFAAALILISACASTVAERHESAASQARVLFFESARGAAALISDRDGRRVLIDSAPDQGFLEGLAGAVPWWDRNLDVLLITRPDVEQLPVFLAIARHYRIKEIWWTGAAPTTEAWKLMDEEILRRGISTRSVQADDVFTFSGMNDLRILEPAERQEGRLLKAAAATALGIVAVFECEKEHLLFASPTRLRPDSRAGHAYTCVSGSLHLVR
jgi:beta-lactamase superfamily II metal-dependent hydrolase